MPLIRTAEVELLLSPGVKARSHQPQTGRSPVQPASLPMESAINIELSVGGRGAARRERMMDGDIVPLRRRPSPGDADALTLRIREGCREIVPALTNAVAHPLRLEDGHPRKLRNRSTQ